MSSLEIGVIEAPEGEGNPFQWEGQATKEEPPAQTVEVLTPAEARPFTTE